MVKEIYIVVRFFVEPPDVSGDQIRLSAGDTTHIRSLRLRPDESFIVCDGEGHDYVCCLGDGDADSRGSKIRSFARIIETRPSLGEPSIDCTVFLSFSKGDRLDYAVQKCVELGACGVVLFPSERCVSLPGDVTGKITRLKRIAVETSKQCGRGRVPSVSAMSCFDAALDAVTHMAITGVRPVLPLFFYECEDELHLKQALEVFRPSLYKTDEDRKTPYTLTGVVPQCDECQLEDDAGDRPFHTIGTIITMTGPEGGFNPAEAELAKAAGMVSVSLGPRLLRCETAPVAALAAVMYHTDNL